MRRRPRPAERARARQAPRSSIKRTGADRRSSSPGRRRVGRGAAREAPRRTTCRGEARAVNSKQEQRNMRVAESTRTPTIAKRRFPQSALMADAAQCEGQRTQHYLLTVVYMSTDNTSSRRPNARRRSVPRTWLPSALRLQHATRLSTTPPTSSEAAEGQPPRHRLVVVVDNDNDDNDNDTRGFVARQREHLMPRGEDAVAAAC